MVEKGIAVDSSSSNTNNTGTGFAKWRQWGRPSGGQVVFSPEVDSGTGEQ